MYWNQSIPNSFETVPWLTLTWDVLKSYWELWPIWGYYWLTLTWDVLKLELINDERYDFMININMRCIEIQFLVILQLYQFRININMRCIEIYQVRAVIFSVTAININMRCIEMIGQTGFTKDRSRLTLTWDVLKSVKGLSNSAYLLMININMRCIEMLKKAKANLMQLRLTLTWDVLKLVNKVATLRFVND